MFGLGLNYQDSESNNDYLYCNDIFQNTRPAFKIGEKIDGNSTIGKRKQEENLKRLLIQLTGEMKQKYSLSQNEINPIVGGVKDTVGADAKILQKAISNPTGKQGKIAAL